MEPAVPAASASAASPASRSPAPARCCGLVSELHHIKLSIGAAHQVSLRSASHPSHVLYRHHRHGRSQSTNRQLRADNRSLRTESRLRLPASAKPQPKAPHPIPPPSLPSVTDEHPRLTNLMPPRSCITPGWPRACPERFAQGSRRLCETWIPRYTQQPNCSRGRPVLNFTLLAKFRVGIFPRSCKHPSLSRQSCLPDKLATCNSRANFPILYVSPQPQSPSP